MNGTEGKIRKRGLLNEAAKVAVFTAVLHTSLISFPGSTVGFSTEEKNSSPKVFFLIFGGW